MLSNKPHDSPVLACVLAAASILLSKEPCLATCTKQLSLHPLIARSLRLTLRQPGSQEASPARKCANGGAWACHRPAVTKADWHATAPLHEGASKLKPSSLLPLPSAAIGPPAHLVQYGLPYFVLQEIIWSAFSGLACRPCSLL